ncbi:MAG: hypothetical protein MI974_22495 [Chitinophagales bacterium]|nr:hypothetical protein [Chitinophagales bacterium]
MKDKVSIINNSINNGLLAAARKCNADIRHIGLWVDGKEPGSTTSQHLGGNTGVFEASHQMYLETLGIESPFYHDEIDNINSFWQPYEKGAAAISDISKYFDWRPDACRSILYFSDTKLAGYGSINTDNDTAVNIAIEIANANGVSLFAHRLDPTTYIGPMNIEEVDEDYKKLCLSTGGYAELGGTASVRLYTRLIEKAICECKHKCILVEKPEIKPCISISWGDTKCDGLESDDCQVFCIKVCNCYSNIAFKDFVIAQIQITDDEGNLVPILPNGHYSVEPVPLGPICFGDILPCVKGQSNCVYRQFMIKTSGAKLGSYQIHLTGICFGIEMNYTDSLCYSIDIC